ncbi:MAG: AMP-binding protein [Planctomycetota bacterium]|nr:AMP-binding protein [Planctomycetota bacterium]
MDPTRKDDGNDLDAAAMGTPWLHDLTIGEVLGATAERFPDGEAYVFEQSHERATWREFDAAVDRVALSLLALGFRPGDRFGVWGTNVPEWVLLQFATARIGVVLVTINPAYRTNEVAYAVRQSKLRGLALIDKYKANDYFATLGEACPELQSAEPGQLASTDFPDLVWAIAMRGLPASGILPWQQFLERSRTVNAQLLADIESQLRCEDPINIQYTSGTTGSPKGAMLSHRNILLNAYYAGVFQRFTSHDRICIPVPLYHCFGCVLGTLCAVAHGATMVFPSETFQSSAVLQAIEDQRCTAIYGVPTMFIGMLEHADYPRRDLSTLRTGIMAGSPCPIELMRRVTGEMGASEITIGYGQTEAAPLITQTRADDPLELRVGTVGRPLPGVEVKVVCPETRQDLGDLQSGELCCRGHNRMIGYFNMPEKTAEVVDAEGWLHTGDLAMRESNGYYRITGRLRDVIIRGGENIYPREIEERLYEHPAVQEVQVVGVPDRKFGEEVLSWVKLREGQSTTFHELKEFCRQGLAHFKVPLYWKFVDSFPTTVTGKVQKFKIREQGIIDLGLQDVARIETA